MKKIIKNNILGFILGIIFCGGIVYAASLYNANDVAYEPTDENWEVTNVSEALDSLYVSYNQSLLDKLSYTVIAKNNATSAATSSASSVSTSITIPSDYDGKEGLVIAFSGQGDGADEDVTLSISKKTGASSMEKLHTISNTKYGGIVEIYKVKYVGNGVITVIGRSTKARRSVSIVALN